MPRVLLYEFLTGGGLIGQPDSPNDVSLRREGAAMLAALATDFAALDGIKTTVILDRRQDANLLPPSKCEIVSALEPGDDCRALEHHCRHADWTIVIAPEFDGLLESRLRLVANTGGRLLGPSPQLAALASDKQRTAEHLAASGVPVPFGRSVDANDLLDTAEEIGFPAVIKPLDGAGSLNVRLVRDRATAARLQAAYRDRGIFGARVRVERYYPGTAASVAVLCGPAGLFPLPPCSQRLIDDGQFRYLGGCCPLDAALAHRAEALAFRAVESLADPLGYLGVDLVLGRGRDDVVIEINPRLTTSYVGLRAVAASNLAEAMLTIADGQSPTLSFRNRCVEYDSDGTVRFAAAIE